MRDGDARGQPASRGRGRRVPVGARRDHQRARRARLIGTRGLPAAFCSRTARCALCSIRRSLSRVSSSRRHALVIATDALVARRSTASLEILVVDDSLTTRTLEKSVLEAHGYQVAIAVDGSGRPELSAREPVGLVISDSQMPRLDGFGLLEEMKRDPRLARHPGDHRLVGRKPRRPGPRPDARRGRLYREAEIRPAGAARDDPADPMKRTSAS